MATWTITITIPDDPQQQTRILNSVSNGGGYDPNLGLTRMQFIKRIVARYLKNLMIEWEVEPAAEAARVQKAAEVNAIDIS